MELSESPIADWSKESEYSSWFAPFDEIETGETGEGFEVIDQGNNEEGGDDD